MRALPLLLLPLFAHAADRWPCAIEPTAVLHDTRSPEYRSPGGAIPADTGVRLRLRVAQEDVTGVQVRVWDTRRGEARIEDMVWDGSHDDSDRYDWWRLELDPGPEPTLLHYTFALVDAEGGCVTERWYVDDDPRFTGGGRGVLTDAFDTRGFQISAYAADFSTPAWMQEAVIYQVFPDRFRNGDPGNDRPAGTFHYGKETILRSGLDAWNVVVCDSRDRGGPDCGGHGSSNFYGGDLDGVTQAIEAGYFDALGVSALYLNPVFASPSNHRYDAADFATVAEDLGGAPAWERLVAAARAHDLRLILDGVFNHVSSDSRYFDRYGRFESVGACEAEDSPFRHWFYLPHVDRAASGGRARCVDDVTYEAWWGYSSLPKLRADHPEVRALVYAGPEAVGPGWIARGGGGWRLDVAGDVDHGVDEPENDFWEGFRAAVKAVDPEAVILGEEWGDASRWLLGGEWDSAMNYRLRSALLGFAFDGCVGRGCAEGAAFSDGDSNDGSQSGTIHRLDPSDLDRRLRGIAEDYPPPAFAAMMNLLGSHDTSRISFLLAKGAQDDDARGRARLRMLWTFLYGYPGAPTIYYGDEVGVVAPSRWEDGWHDDPYNRAPFPWPEEPGDYAADLGLQASARWLASARWSVAALRRGSLTHGVIVDDARGLYGYARGEAALVVVNRGVRPAEVALPEGWPRDVEWVDLASGAPVDPEAVGVPPSGGVMLSPQSAVDRPAAPSPSWQGGLVWPVVARDTDGGREVAVRYAVYRGEGPEVSVDGDPLAWITPPPFGGAVRFVDPEAPAGAWYRVVAWNTVQAGPPSVAVAAGTPPPDAESTAPPVDGGRPPSPGAVRIDPHRAATSDGCAQAPGTGWPWGLLAAALIRGRRRCWPRAATARRHRGSAGRRR